MRSAYEAEKEIAKYLWIGIGLIVLLGTLWMHGLI